jgi:hypothetical protein
MWFCGAVGIETSETGRKNPNAIAVRLPVRWRSVRVAFPGVRRRGHHHRQRDGRVLLFKADPSAFRHLATNCLSDESFASPAACGGRLSLRVADTKAGVPWESLYCVGR